MTLKHTLRSALLSFAVATTGSAQAQTLEDVVGSTVIDNASSQSDCLAKARIFSRDNYDGEAIAFICSNNFNYIQGTPTETIAITGICKERIRSCTEIAYLGYKP